MICTQSTWSLCWCRFLLSYWILIPLFPFQPLCTSIPPKPLRQGGREKRPGDRRHRLLLTVSCWLGALSSLGQIHFYLQDMSLHFSYIFSSDHNNSIEQEAPWRIYMCMRSHSQACTHIHTYPYLLGMHTHTPTSWASGIYSLFRIHRIKLPAAGKNHVRHHARHNLVFKGAKTFTTSLLRTDFHHLRSQTAGRQESG